MNGLEPGDASDKFADLDSDLLLNYYEMTNSTDPQNPDTDGDYMWDGWELLYAFDPLNPLDGVEDFDFDGLPNYLEYISGTIPTNPDTDGDTMTDGFEVSYDLNANFDDRYQDYDSDGLTNIEEFNAGTLPNNVDTDGDYLNDYDELRLYFSDPLQVDTDGDGLHDGYEVIFYNSDPTLVDTDGDSLTDYQEVMITHTDPSLKDSDRDGINDGLEIQMGTDPNSMASSPLIFIIALSIIGLGVFIRAIVSQGAKSKRERDASSLGPHPEAGEVIVDISSNNSYPFSQNQKHSHQPQLEIYSKPKLYSQHELNSQQEHLERPIMKEIRPLPKEDPKLDSYHQGLTPAAKKLLTGECPVCLHKIDKYSMRCQGCQTNYSSFFKNYLKRTSK
jgi:hypothetical protein